MQLWWNRRKEERSKSWQRIPPPLPFAVFQNFFSFFHNCFEVAQEAEFLNIFFFNVVLSEPRHLYCALSEKHLSWCCILITSSISKMKLSSSVLRRNLQADTHPLFRVVEWQWKCRKSPFKLLCKKAATTSSSKTSRSLNSVPAECDLLWTFPSRAVFLKLFWTDCCFKYFQAPRLWWSLMIPKDLIHVHLCVQLYRLYFEASSTSGLSSELLILISL